MERYSGSQPVGLANVLNPTEEQRDSAYYSSGGDASKHTSTVSCNGGPFSPASSASYHSPAADKTPSPIATTNGIPPLVSPTSAGMSVASLVSPTTPSSVDHNMLRKLDQRASYDAPSLTGPNGESLSRRESVDSRMNQTFEGLRLASSPYASNNQSTTSLQSNLQQQRNPGAAANDRLSAQRFSNISNSYQPITERYPVSEPQKQSISRTAPAITGPAAGSVAHAAEPTKGQAWAFPDEPGHRIPSGRPSGESAVTLPTSYVDSPRSSVADSRASSQFTEARLPPGQRRLEDGMPLDYPRISRASSDFQGASHHHHTLQHKQVGELRENDSSSTGSGGGGTYSRTPELRISHKLAERKRRTEMKDLFEQLRDLMPQERGNKASKWEILSRAIAEHHRQEEYIRSLTEACHRAQEELSYARQESNILRSENRQLRQDLAPGSGVHHIASHPAPPPAAQGPPPPPPAVEAYPADPYARALPHRPVEMRPELPPLRAMQAQPESMTGVQYQHAERF